MRYFFDLHNGIDTIDLEGVELLDVAAAYQQAMLEARTMASASIVRHGRVDLQHFIQTRDEAGSVFDKVRFEDAVSFLRDSVKL